MAYVAVETAMNEVDEKKINTEEKEETPTPEGKESEDSTPRVVSLEELNRKIETYEAEIKDLKDKYLRALADMDNFRKRVEREKAELFNYGLTNFLKELLPIMDTLESAVTEAQKSGNNREAIVEGIKLILSKFQSTLKKHGVTEIEALNKPFDPAYHEALAQTERADVEPMTVVEELEKGYILKGRILRPSKVIVAVAPREKNGEGTQSREEKNNSGKDVEDGKGNRD